MFENTDPLATLIEPLNQTLFLQLDAESRSMSAPCLNGI